MRVLIAAPDQLLVRHGGLRTQVERTVEELRRLGCEITLFNSWDRYHLKKFDVAHVFSMNAPLYYKAQAIANYGMPLVFSSVMWRSGNPRIIRLSVEMLRRIPKQLINDVAACREMSAWAQRILPNTDAERQWLGQAIGVSTDKCAVVPNGVDDLPEGCSGDELRTSFPEGAWPTGDYVLCVAALITRKNLDLLADVARECGYPLVLVGPQTDARLVQRLRRLQAQHPGQLFLPGPMEPSDPRLSAAYRQCRVFCLPSDYETPGIAALEAALKGARIAITEVGGTREYFGEHARYLQPRSRVSLREALVASWQDGRPGNGAAIRERLLGEFSWNAVAAKTMQEYSAVCAAA